MQCEQGKVISAGVRVSVYIYVCVCVCVCVCACVCTIFFLEYHFRDSLVYMTLYRLLSVEVGKGLPMSPGNCEIGIWILIFSHAQC